MSPGKQHVVHIGFHASEAHTVDFDADHVTVVMSRSSAARLPAELASRFARIAVLDLPDSDDLDTYDRAVDRMRELVAGLAAEFGPPAAIVALYEHTTLPAARLREHFGVPGTDVRTALLCRDKVPMKEALAGTGIRVPRFLAVGARRPAPRNWPSSPAGRPAGSSSSRAARARASACASSTTPRRSSRSPRPGASRRATRSRSSWKARSTTSTVSSGTGRCAGSAPPATSTPASTSSTATSRWRR
ncbi:hypothetical protein GQS52_16075 [Streptomyces sp. SCUT-3]|uniref:hypothetical protein n=1 Tax=Streptomyces sp. SCUT-3 TaxID=2684469 RepID=UPI0015FB5DD0|nr:hypothetical protein [Streptomyces sp. SCUT-3]QMV23041.1 hypothetical protein GQS52_16075 [Streptomyces sp. SCUT-3]